MGAGDVAGLDACGESVMAAVRHGDGFGLVTEGQDRQDRTEDFLDRRGVVRGDSCDHGRRDIPPVNSARAPRRTAAMNREISQKIGSACAALGLDAVTTRPLTPPSER